MDTFVDREGDKCCPVARCQAIVIENTRERRPDFGECLMSGEPSRMRLPTESRCGTCELLGRTAAGEEVAHREAQEIASVTGETVRPRGLNERTRGIEMLWHYGAPRRCASAAESRK